MTTAPHASAWLHRFGRESADRPLLVCFPYAGGSAKYFLAYARALAAHADVLAVQYPGRQERRNEPPVDSITELARLVADELLPHTDRPMAFFGHSMGAALAFEVARAVENKGTVLSALFVSGRRAPSRHRVERTHLLDDHLLLGAVRALAGVSSTLPGFDSFARNALPLIRVDYRAAETYRYVDGPALACPIVALTGDRDPLASVAEVASWHVHTTARFELSVFAGGHFFLNEHRTGVVEVIAKHLAQISDSTMRA